LKVLRPAARTPYIYAKEQYAMPAPAGKPCLSAKRRGWLTPGAAPTISRLSAGGMATSDIIHYARGRWADPAASACANQQGRPMANTPSAKKAARKIERRTEVNRSRRSRVRTYLRKLEDALASGDASAATAAFKAAEPEIMRAVTKGVLHKNTASRKVSRLASRVRKLSA